MYVKKVIIALGMSAMAIGFGQANAIDKETYLRLANSTIQEANGGFIANVNQLISVQEQLIKLGIEGSKDYIKSHPEHADVLGEVIASAEDMKNMTLEEIEDQWHSGKHMRSKGFDLDKFDHFGDIFSLMDSIIHPATSYIALNDYKRTRQADLLARASAELTEVVEHVQHIGSAHGTQLTENQ